MTTKADYQTSLDTIWRKLRPHLEWTEGFTLAVLFTRHPAPVDALHTRLQEFLSINTLPLRKFVLQSPGQIEAILTAVLSSRPLDGRHPPLWIEMWRDVGSDKEQRKEQRRAVWQTLSRLNERRFLLEHDVACPLVLILPAELRMDISGMAPDLWSVRSFTADLPTPVSEIVTGRGKEQVTTDLPQDIISHEPSAAETEWQRLWKATKDKKRLAPEAGFAAVDMALERMDYVAARQIIDQVLELLRSGGKKRKEPNALRRYSIAINYSGRVDKDLGRLEEARTAYAESLELCRRLREALGDAPQTLRDLSVSLDNINP
ncbi:MAG: hypothetical protein ABH886_07870 [Candidatus Desantisbacteria bacterium]